MTNLHILASSNASVPKLVRFLREYSSRIWSFQQVTTNHCFFTLKQKGTLNDPLQVGANSSPTQKKCYAFWSVGGNTLWLGCSPDGPNLMSGRKQSAVTRGPSPTSSNSVVDQRKVIQIHLCALLLSSSPRQLFSSLQDEEDTTPSIRLPPLPSSLLSSNEQVCHSPSASAPPLPLSLFRRIFTS